MPAESTAQSTMGMDPITECSCALTSASSAISSPLMFSESGDMAWREDTRIA
jgi:hypothetical protein